MTETVQFAVGKTAYLGEDGSPLGPLPDFTENPDELIKLYQQMVLVRAFDNKAVALQRTGRLGTYAPCLGQEAVGVGLGAALKPEDVFFPSFREQATQVMHGVKMEEILLYWGGDERGSNFASGNEDFPICVPVGTHPPHAVGAALAFKLRGEKRAAVCAFGDGATSKGDVYEAMNMAGAWEAPALFFVTNNQWAISVPRKAQTACETLAQKAIAAGFEGEQVDGNDVIAVKDVAARALEKVRNGGGPHLIEAVTYRLNDHTTADDATRYRDDAEVAKMWKADPIARLRAYLVSLESWNKEQEEKLQSSAAKAVGQVVENYLATDPPEPTTMFDHLFETLPDDLKPQRRHLENQVKMQEANHG